MVPAGYLLKRPKPLEWLQAPQVTEVCSVSDCVNPNIVDVEKIWMHNDFGLASSPETLWRLADENHLDISDAELFYYEIYEQEADTETGKLTPVDWRPLTHIPSAGVHQTPDRISMPARLLGYDVVTNEDYLEHSPLACNSIAESLPVNTYCLFDTLDQAKAAIEIGSFDNCEPGIYKIYSVYRVDSSRQST